MWIAPITAALKPTLARISPFTAGPLLPERGAQFFLNTYPDVPVGNGRGVLAVYIWTAAGSPPPIPGSITPRRISAGTAVALVPRDRVEQAIESSLQANGLRSLPKEVGGLTIMSFSIAWRDFGVGDGHCFISGATDHFPGSVTFRAWVKLFVDSGNVKVNVIRTDHEGSFFVDVFDLFSSGAITRTLEEILPRAVGGIGGGAFGQLGVFATSAVPEPQAFATMDVTGNIAIWPGGLGLPAGLTARASCAPRHSRNRHISAATSAVASSTPTPASTAGSSNNRHGFRPGSERSNSATTGAGTAIATTTWSPSANCSSRGRVRHRPCRQ